MAQRKYTVGNDRALFLFSKGYCYFPKCPVKVFRKIGSDLFTQVERAHIFAVERGGPRWRPLSERELNSHANLMLMCQPHHEAVDRNATKYPSELLRKWKKEREGEQMDALRGLEGLSEEHFKEILVDYVSSVKAEILDAIKEQSNKDGLASDGYNNVERVNSRERNLNEPHQPTERDVFQQTGKGNMPVHTGSGDLNVNFYLHSPPQADAPAQHVAPNAIAPHASGASDSWRTPTPPIGVSTTQSRGGFWRKITEDRRWYFLVAIASAGVLAWIPFVHAAIQQKRSKFWILAAIFTVSGIIQLALTGIAPGKAEAPSSPLRTFAGFFSLVVIASACIFLVKIRNRALEGRVAPVARATVSPTE